MINNKYVPTFGEFLAESKKAEIKKYVRRYSPARDRVLMFFQDKGKVTQKEFQQYLAGLSESEGIKISPSYISKNKSFFKKSKKNGTVFFELNAFGKKVAAKTLLKENHEEPDGDENEEEYVEIQLEPEEHEELRRTKAEDGDSGDMKNDVESVDDFDDDIETSHTEDSEEEEDENEMNHINHDEEEEMKEEDGETPEHEVSETPEEEEEEHKEEEVEEKRDETEEEMQERMKKMRAMRG